MSKSATPKSASTGAAVAPNIGAEDADLSEESISTALNAANDIPPAMRAARTRPRTPVEWDHAIAALYRDWPKPRERRDN